MSDLENVPPSGRHPQDPAGTQPRYDPDSLLPANPVPDDVVDADIVEEREEQRGDLLPARRGSGGCSMMGWSGPGARSCRVSCPRRNGVENRVEQLKPPK